MGVMAPTPLTRAQLTDLALVLHLEGVSWLQRALAYPADFCVSCGIDLFENPGTQVAQTHVTAGSPWPMTLTLQCDCGRSVNLLLAEVSVRRLLATP